MFSEVAEIALVATRLGQFQQLLKTHVILILNFTRPHAITYTYRERNTEKLNLARIALKRLQTPWKQKIYTQQEKVSRFYYFFPYFELFRRSGVFPIQTLIIIITPLRNVMLTVTRELGLPVTERVVFSSLHPWRSCA